MSDELRKTLKAVDGSAVQIQAAANALMKHYGTTASVAVTAWRDAVHSYASEKGLALLYVANEVLQISKRNRGAAFLEAFGEVLGPCCAAICRADPTVTEKVRRTVKIWGDRRVFSPRFVGELLKGLEPYRTGASAASNSVPPKPVTSSKSTKEADDLPPSPNENNDDDDDDDDDIMKLLDQDDAKNESSYHDDSEEDDIFASESGTSKLRVDIDLDRVASASSSPTNQKAKRRRSSMGSTGSTSGSHKKTRRKRTAWTITQLFDTWKRLSELDQSFEESQLALQKIDASLTRQSPQELEQLVGDELQEAFKQTQEHLQMIAQQRQALYDNAKERRGMETEVVAAIPWLQHALQVDEDDIKFCGQLETQLTAFSDLHGKLRQAREEHRADLARQRAAAEQAERRRREAEETERFRKAALSRHTTDGKNMKWNPATREYQEINTDESWREH